MKTTKSKKDHSFPWFLIYIPLGYIFYCSALVGLVYESENDKVDIIQTFLQGIGLSQESVILIMLLLVAIIVVVATLVKYGKIHEYLKKNVGPFLEKNIGHADQEQGPANKGIAKIIGDVAAMDGRLTPLGEIANIKTSVDAATNGICSANATLQGINTAVEILKNQAETIEKLQLSNPNATQAIQGVQAAFLSVAEDFIREKQENQQLREELKKCYIKIEALEQQLPEQRPTQSPGLKPRL